MREKYTLHWIYISSLSPDAGYNDINEKNWHVQVLREKKKEVIFLCLIIDIRRVKKDKLMVFSQKDI